VFSLKFQKRVHNTLFSLVITNAKPCVGVSSFVPTQDNFRKQLSAELRLHYPLIDADGTTQEDLSNFLYACELTPFLCYSTQHGSHAIILNEMSFQQTVQTLLACPYSDRVHIAMGIKRGYWFLDTKTHPFTREELKLYNLSTMRIERNVEPKLHQGNDKA
jgi:hypothetical protein